MGLITYSCSYNTMVDFPGPERPILFSEQVLPIFSEQGCTGCHGSMGGLDLKNNVYDNILDGRVDLETPPNSLIYSEAHPDGTHATKLTKLQSEIILYWIEEGAENN